MPHHGPRALTFCLSLALCLLGTACTGDTDPSRPDRSGNGSEVGAEDDVTPPGPQRRSAIFDPDDDVLNVAVSEPSTLDPLRIQDPGSVLVARQLYEGLTRWDPLAEKVRPAAARSWKVSKGGRRFTFKLRPGSTFHDGSPVKAKDFRYAFDRIASKRNASDLAYTLDMVAGFTEVNQLGTSRHLAGVTARDRSTLRIDLKEPFHDLPAVLTHPALVPLPAKRVRRIDEFLAAPVGNGPFRIAEPWAPGQPVILEAFSGSVQSPKLDGIRFIPYPDAAASWLSFRNGEIDVAEVPAGQIQDAEQAYGDDGFQPFLASYYYGFNLRAEGSRNFQLRKAINRAIDRDEIASRIYKGTMVAPRGIVPAGIPGFHQNICVSLCEYEPSVARSLIRRVKPRDRKLTLEFTKGEPHEQVARLVKSDLRDVGLKVGIRAFTFSKYLKRLRDGQQGVYRLGWIAEYPVADVFLSPLFATDSSDNHSGFSSAKVDSLLKKAHRTRSQRRRVQLYVKVEKEILKKFPIVPIGSFVTHWAAQPRVSDLNFDVMGGFDATTVSLDPAVAEG